jgi:hypothetical protein
MNIVAEATVAISGTLSKSGVGNVNVIVGGPRKNGADDLRLTLRGYGPFAEAIASLEEGDLVQFEGVSFLEEVTNSGNFHGVRVVAVVSSVRRLL